MMKRWILAALLPLSVSPASAAVGTFVAAASRTDMAHDAKHGVVYIANGTQVLRWQESTKTFLTPVTLGGSLGGMDISIDDNQVAVADMSGPWIHLIDTNTQEHHKVLLERDFMEGGTYTAVYGADGKIYTTSTFQGSGWVPLRRIDPASGTAVTVYSVRQNSPLAASGAGQTIAFAESNISDGAWGLVDIPTGTVVSRSGYSNGTSTYNYDVATDPWGAQFVLNGTMVYDDAYWHVDNVAGGEASYPMGGVYDPVERKYYSPAGGSTLVRILDMSTNPNTLVGSYDIGSSLAGGGTFGSGHMKVSRDGSLLMVNVEGGVHVVRQYAGLQAGTLYKTVVPDTVSPITVPGSIGGGKTLAWSITANPLHGTVSIANGVATYTPTAGYRGKDRFWYQVKYGRAVRTAGVSLLVDRVPVAVADEARTDKDAILIPVLANDSDGDAGDTLSIKTLVKPGAGSATIEGDQVRFVPPKVWTSPVYFTYTVTDGHDGEATATVRVAPTKPNAQPSHPIPGSGKPRPPVRR
jgi:hypothetical protein